MSAAVQSVKPVAKERDLAQDPDKLRWRRRAAGLTLPQLGERAGLSAGYISMLERRQRCASVTTLKQLAAALECEIADLMPPEPTARRKKAA